MLSRRLTISGPILSILTISCSFLACDKQQIGPEVASEGSTSSSRMVQVSNNSGVNLTTVNDAHEHAISAGILNDRAQFLPQPDFPETARSQKVRGQVSVQIAVDKSGNVASAVAVKGHPTLRRSAETAARKARFAPMIINNRAVRFVGVLEYRFEP